MPKTPHSSCTRSSSSQVNAGSLASTGSVTGLRLLQLNKGLAKRFNGTRRHAYLEPQLSRALVRRSGSSLRGRLGCALWLACARCFLRLLRQVLLRIHRQQRFDGDLGLLKNGVGARIADPRWLVPGKRSEQDKDDGHEQEAARQAENEAQGAVERADTAVQHAVGDAEGDQAYNDQRKDEDAGGKGDLGHARIVDIGREHARIFRR